MLSAPKDKSAFCPQNPLEEMMDVASATECTGLIPTPPADEAQAQSYAQLYPIPQPPKPPRKGEK